MLPWQNILQRANMLNLIYEFTNAIGKSWIVKFELFISWHISHPSFGLPLKYCCIEARKHLIIKAARYWITHEMTMHIDMFNSWFKTSQLWGRAVQVVESLQRWEGRGWHDGPLTRNVKLRVAHAPWMPGTFSPPLRVSVPDMHHGTWVTHVPWCMPGSLTTGFLGSQWRGKRSRHSRRMRNPQFYLSGKRPITKLNRV